MFMLDHLEEDLIGLGISFDLIQYDFLLSLFMTIPRFSLSSPREKQ